MSRSVTHAYEQHAQIFRNVARFIQEVIAIEVIYRLAILSELRKEGLSIFKNVPLVQESKKIAKIEVSHLFCYKRSFECYFLDKPSYLEIWMASYTIVKNEQPHSKIFKNQQLIVFKVSLSIRLPNYRAISFDKVVKKVNSVPDRFSQVATKAFQSVIDIEKCRPKLLKFFFCAMKLQEPFCSVLSKQLQIFLQNIKGNLSTHLVNIF